MDREKLIPTYVHGLLDHLVVGVLFVGPQLPGVRAVGGAALVVPQVIGGILLLQAMFTRYELGVIKKFPMRLHLVAESWDTACASAGKRVRFPARYMNDQPGWPS